MRTASVGQKCPECAAPVGRARVITADQIGSEKVRSAPFSYGVIGIAVALFVVGFVVPGANRWIFGYAAQINPLVERGELWRLLSATLLHSGIVHVGFNMWALSIFGPPLEREVGTVPFATMYISGALAGGVLFYILSPGASAVGASGAIFALFGAWLAASYRNRRTMQGRANLQQLLLLLGLNAAISFMPGIAWEAHLGGLVAGFAIVMAWLPLADRADARRLRTLVAAAPGLLALAAVLFL
jgi:membrane associated rhomboid family serine protease